MTIHNHRGQDHQTSDFPGSQAEAHSLIALEQSALYAARLAIARWISTSMAATTPLAQPVPSRATWYAQAQQNFQEWLGRGGFAQYDIAGAGPAEPLIAPTLYDVSKPLAGTGSRNVDSCVD